MFKELQKGSYEIFVNKVMAHRKLSKDEVSDVAQGQLFTGKQAKDLHLVDELGGFYDVVDELSKEINVSNPQLVFYRPENQSVVVKLLNMLSQFL